MSKGRTIVKNNGHNAALNILDTGKTVLATVTTQQRELKIVDKKVTTIVKEGNIIGSIKDMLTMDYKVNETLPGHVVIKQSIYPPYPDYPEEKLKWENGKVVRTRYGHPVYEWSYYTEDINDTDNIIV